MNNPFSLTFGIEPKNYIDRIIEKDQIICSFSSESPSNYVYLLTGVRGSGKLFLCIVFPIILKIKKIG